MPVYVLSLLPPPHPPPSPPPPAIPPCMFQPDNDLVTLNSLAELDFFTSYNQYYRDVIVNDDPYYGIEINSVFHDIHSLSNICSAHKSIFLSINIQSLMSKHEQLCIELAEFKRKNIIVDAIAIQETWDIKYPELVQIEGFNQIVFKRRRGMRGGGSASM